MSLNIMIVAGEPSGDALGAQLMAALARNGGSDLKITGIGGVAMAAQGLESLFPIDDIAVMGLAEVVPRLPVLLKRIGQTVDHVLATRPDALVLIDSPGFNHQIARRLKRRGFTGVIVKYVAPQVWASRPGRAARIARFIDHVLTLFPFEPPYFETAGLAATFVGHPVMERPVSGQSGTDFRRARNIPPQATVLCVLPGSRLNEVHYLLPVFGDVVRRLARRMEALHIVVPTLPNVARPVKNAVQAWPVPVHVVEGENPKFAAFRASTAALAASGTVSLELALAEVPAVIGYKVGWLTAALARRFLLVPYITLINILMDREVIPEFLQERCRADLLTEAVSRLLEDKEARRAQLAGVRTALDMLRVDGMAPSRRAAHVLMEIVRTHRAASSHSPLAGRTR